MKLFPSLLCFVSLADTSCERGCASRGHVCICGPGPDAAPAPAAAAIAGSIRPAPAAPVTAAPVTATASTLAALTEDVSADLELGRMRMGLFGSIPPATVERDVAFGVALERVLEGLVKMAKGIKGSTVDPGKVTDAMHAFADELAAHDAAADAKLATKPAGVP